MSGTGTKAILAALFIAALFLFWLATSIAGLSHKIESKSIIGEESNQEVCQPCATCPVCPSQDEIIRQNGEKEALQCPPCLAASSCPICPEPSITPSVGPCPQDSLKLEVYQKKVEELVSGIMMDREEVIHIISFLKPDQTFIEWGSGGSTTVYSQFVADYYSIEHNEQWCNKVKANTEKNNLSNIHYHCLDYQPGHKGWKGGFKEGTYHQFKDYVDIIDTLPPKKYDVALVDGRARISCALKLLPYLKEDSIVFVHDVFFSRDYRIVLEYYDLVSVIFSTRGLVALKPKATKKVTINDECEYTPSCQGVGYEDGSKGQKELFNSRGVAFFLGLKD